VIDDPPNVTPSTAEQGRCPLPPETGSHDWGSDAAAPGAALLAQWIENTRPALLSYARHCVSSELGTHVEAEDVLHDSLLAAWRARDDLPVFDTDAFSRWMRRVIRNRTFELLRYQGTRRASSSAHPSRRGPEAIDDPEARVGNEVSSGREEADRLAANIRRLSLEEHLCVVMHDLAGLSWEVVAAALGRSVDGAKAVRRRARAKLGSGG